MQRTYFCLTLGIALAMLSACSTTQSAQDTTIPKATTTTISTTTTTTIATPTPTKAPTTTIAKKKTTATTLVPQMQLIGAPLLLVK